MDPTDNLMNQISDSNYSAFPKPKKKFTKENPSEDPLSELLKKKPKFQGIGTPSEEKHDESHNMEYLKLKRYTEICIKDMQNNMTYKTSLIILKVLENNSNVNDKIGSGLTFLAEDKNSTKAIVVVHDFTGERNKYKNGVYFRVFQPYYLFLDKSIIKVTPQENLMLNSDWEEFGKTISLDEKKADDLKNEGNTYFSKGDWECALECYSNAISIYNSNPIFYSNRSITYTNLELFDLGLKDAERAIELDTEAKIKLFNQNSSQTKKSFFDKSKSSISVNPKFTYRKILNLIGLEEYDEASKLLESHIKILQEEKNTKFMDEFKMLLVTVEKYKNHVKGKLDYIPFVKCYKEGKKLPELATFIGDIEIQASKVHGNGVFATRDIKYGELIIVSKAVLFTKDQSTSTNDFFLKLELSQQLKEKLNKLSSVSNLLNNKLVHFDYFNTLKQKFDKDRYSTSNESQNNTNLINYFKPNSLSHFSSSTNVTLSTEILNSIIEHNSFIDYSSIPNISKIEDTFFTNSKKSTSFILGSGLWLIPSFFNNSCIENTTKFFISDYILIFANKDINKGEELFTSYCEDIMSYDKRKEVFESRYHFICNCDKCNFENSEKGRLLFTNIDNGINNLKNAELGLDKKDDVIKVVLEIEESLNKFGNDIIYLNNYSYPLILLSTFNILDNFGLNSDDDYNDTKYKILQHICKMDNLKFYWTAKFLGLSIEIAKFDGDKKDQFDYFKNEFSKKINPLDDFVKEWLNLVK